MEKPKFTDYVFALLFFVSLFGLIIQINNYNTHLHNIDLSFNVFRMVDDFNIKMKQYYINSSNIEDYTDYGRKRNLYEMYVYSLGKLRTINISIIFLSMSLMYSTSYFMNYGRRK